MTKCSLQERKEKDLSLPLETASYNPFLPNSFGLQGEGQENVNPLLMKLNIRFTILLPKKPTAEPDDVSPNYFKATIHFIFTCNLGSKFYLSFSIKTSLIFGRGGCWCYLLVRLVELFRMCVFFFSFLLYLGFTCLF